MKNHRLLYWGIFVAIVFMSAPELLAAIELVALLEVLGAALFITASGAGLRVAAERLTHGLRRLFDPPWPMHPRACAAAGTRTLATIYHFAHVAWMIGFGVVVVSYGRELHGMFF